MELFLVLINFSEALDISNHSFLNFHLLICKTMLFWFSPRSPACFLILPSRIICPSLKCRAPKKLFKLICYYLTCVCICTHIHYVSIVCVSVFCLHVCLCTMCVHGAQRVQKRASDALRLELQMDMNCHVGAGNGNHVFWKISQ